MFPALEEAKLIDYLSTVVWGVRSANICVPQLAREAKCPRCSNSADPGILADGSVCPKCSGTGRVLVSNPHKPTRCMVCDKGTVHSCPNCLGTGLEPITAVPTTPPAERYVEPQVRMLTTMQAETGRKLRSVIERDREAGEALEHYYSPEAQRFHGSVDFDSRLFFLVCHTREGQALASDEAGDTVFDRVLAAYRGKHTAKPQRKAKVTALFDEAKRKAGAVLVRGQALWAA